MSANRTKSPSRPLYTSAQRARRDATKWTLVQGILAPVQFLAFAVSLVLVLLFLATGDHYQAATVSILVKTALLAAIMVTGAIWEKVVFGQYLFAPAFFWEDVFSFAVIGFHTWYVIGLMTGSLGPQGQMLVTLAAYGTYLVNATQFLLKLRKARLDTQPQGVMA
ncbi:2-vinyl bacteriochlorophyllide hydratase [Stagnihabitans tardus]|uniref:2-vinyl bacteriochlorophyllide hydratase n=1 Tax=Stagnihabitans tardus TaxID=2699202 RepID=A0AAE4YB47_9RHOB|nr:2-vinyl bacteriochlorophyllide hydratase [Stagnihabitans tardus]NBZ86400.1 2-vinyl bacteriochlorophyllide hydratase [Stagnihabitans tardus]